MIASKLAGWLGACWLGAAKGPSQGIYVLCKAVRWACCPAGGAPTLGV